MKKSSITLGILSVFASFAFAESQVTLYGIIEDGVLVSKAWKDSVKSYSSFRYRLCG